MIKKTLLTAFCAVWFGIIQAQPVPIVSVNQPAVVINQNDFYARIPFVGNVVNYARRHLAVRYRSGGTTTHGFDCSGFTRFCFNRFGVSLPHSSAAQGNVGRAIDRDDAQPGDLILFKGHSTNNSQIGHVGLITEVVGSRIRFIHSAWSGGVRYDYLHADYYQRRFVGVRRVARMLASK